jgi:hypothetical protein
MTANNLARDRFVNPLLEPLMLDCHLKADLTTRVAQEEEFSSTETQFALLVVLRGIQGRDIN